MAKFTISHELFSKSISFHSRAPLLSKFITHKTYHAATMNAVITAAANQARQKPVKLSHNQEVSVAMYIPDIYVIFGCKEMMDDLIDGHSILLAKELSMLNGRSVRGLVRRYCL